jgi:hypothetical protein
MDDEYLSRHQCAKPKPYELALPDSSMNVDDVRLSQLREVPEEGHVVVDWPPADRQFDVRLVHDDLAAAEHHRGVTQGSLGIREAPRDAREIVHVENPQGEEKLASLF